MLYQTSRKISSDNKKFPKTFVDDLTDIKQILVSSFENCFFHLIWPQTCRLISFILLTCISLALVCEK